MNCKRIIRVFPLIIVFGILIHLNSICAAQTTSKDTLYQNTGDSVRIQQDTTGIGSAQTPLTFAFKNNNTLNFGWMIVKTGGYFVLIVALIFLFVFVMKRLTYGRKNGAGNTRTIRVLNSTFIGPKKSLLLVEAAGHILIIAVTDTQMNLITELPKEEYDAYIKETGVQKSPAVPNGSQFGTMFEKILKWHK